MDLRKLQMIKARKEVISAPPKMRNGYPVLGPRKKKTYKMSTKPSNGVGVGY